MKFSPALGGGGVKRPNNPFIIIPTFTNAQGQGRSKRESGNPPPPKKSRKELLKKNGGISDGAIFRNKFSKNKIKHYKPFNFSVEFSTKFSQNFPTICVFRPIARKINAWFANIFEKYVKIMHF